LNSDHEIAEELAACLERFLTASADENVMRRAARALDDWSELTAGLTVSVAAPRR
jgi:hypothetical protein